MGWEQELTDSAYNNDIETVRRFLREDEVRRTIGRKTWTWGEAPLHRAAAIGRNDILRLLVEAGGDIGSYSVHDNDDRMTCLHLAVWCNQVDTVALLLQLGADPTLTGTWLDYTGTPLDFARQYRNHEVIEVFREMEEGGLEDGRSSRSGHAKGRRIVHQPASKINTSAILSGLENLPTKEKALAKSIDLQRKAARSEKNVSELRRRLLAAEKELTDIKGNPYYLDQEAIDNLTVEIEELKMFSVEVRKILSDRRRGQEEV